MKATIFYILLTVLAHSRGQYHYQGLMNYLENRMIAMEVRSFWFIWPRFNILSAVLLVFSHFTETSTFLGIRQNSETMLILRVLYIYSTRQHLKMLAISVAQFVQSESTHTLK